MQPKSIKLQMNMVWGKKGVKILNQKRGEKAGLLIYESHTYRIGATRLVGPQGLNTARLVNGKEMEANNFSSALDRKPIQDKYPTFWST